MRPAVLAALVALALGSGCSTKAPENGSAYLRVRPESLTDPDGRKGYERRRIEVVTLVGEDGYARLTYGLFHLENGAIPPANVTPASGYQMMRLRGTYHDTTPSHGPVLSVDSADPIEVPLRAVTLADIDADPKSFDGAHVTLEGTYFTRIEHPRFPSKNIAPDPGPMLDAKVWVVPPTKNNTDIIPNGRLRITGWLFTRGGHFGPFRQGRYALTAETWKEIP